MLELELRLRPGLLYANAEGITAGIVHGNILVLLKKAQFAHALNGNTARSQVGDGARTELQPRVCDVHFVGHDRDAQRVNGHHRRIYQRQQNVQVVNHHVVNHVDIQTPRGEDTQPMNFKIKWPPERAERGNDPRIKPLQVANLQDTSSALCGGNQPVGLER